MTMSMTSKKAYAVGMGPFPDGVYRAQFPYYYRNPEGMPQEAALDYYLNSIKDVFEQCGPAAVSYTHLLVCVYNSFNVRGINLPSFICALFI